jgi:hypothetical protein
MQGSSHPGEMREGGDVEDRRRDVKSLAPACGVGSDSALETWKRRERARALLNAREHRRARSERHQNKQGSERPLGG